MKRRVGTCNSLTLMPKPNKNKSPVQNVHEGLFFIDKRGDASKHSSEDIPIIRSHSPVVVEDFISHENSLSKKPKVVVIGSSQSSDGFEVLSDDEGEEESILFQGRTSYAVSSSLDSECDSDEYVISDDSTDSSVIMDDYIQNLEEDESNDDMLDHLQNMNLDEYPSGDDSGPDESESAASNDLLDDDEAFAELAHGRRFLLNSPSTLMDNSLDATAAEFLARKQPRNGRGKGKGKKGKAKHGVVEPQDPFEYDGPYTIGAISFRQINRELKAFVNDDIEDCLEMDPMPPLPRKFLHELAHIYGLKSKSAGQGRDRHCVLYKTERSSLPRNVKAVKVLVDRADQAVLWMDKSVSKGKKFTQASVPSHVKETRVRGGKGKKKSASSEPAVPSTKPAVGTVIGKHARPIAEDNIGNRLLQKMGWKPGQSLGVGDDGILQPVEAVVRGKRTGLGHGAGSDSE